MEETIMAKISPTGKVYGHLPSTPDHRDFAFSATITPQSLPTSIDLRTIGFMPPIKDQKTLGC